MSYYLVEQSLKEEFSLPRKTLFKLSLRLIDNKIKRLRERLNKTQDEIQYLSASDINNNDKLKKKAVQLQRITNRINDLTIKRNQKQTPQNQTIV